MDNSTVLFRARVSRNRLRRVEKVLSRLGLKPGDAFNMLLAQIELREAVPFPITARPGSLLTSEEQAGAWTKALGAY
jgi:antitoxin component of RelBE/YafQ-DinJ toxin-antitoxin module